VRIASFIGDEYSGLPVFSKDGKTNVTVFPKDGKFSRCISQGLERFTKSLPRLGKTGPIFSRVWKNAPCGGREFHVKSAALPVTGGP
jgi:hypothetical protein